MTPADRDRFEKCLALAAHGATAGERAAARAAATRIAVGAGLTLAEAIRAPRRDPDAAAAPRTTAAPPRRAYAWAQPKAPPQPITVAEMTRQKAETAAWRKRRTAASDRVRQHAAAQDEAYAAEQRAGQAERDRLWQARASTPPSE